MQCEFCKQEYRHIGKHKWRCKERLNLDESAINIDLFNGNHNTHGTANVEAIHEAVYVNNPSLNSKQARIFPLDETHLDAVRGLI